MVKAVVADEARIKAFEDGVDSSGAPRSQVTLPSFVLVLSNRIPGSCRCRGGDV